MSYQVVHVRINDAATGQPTPVRVRFSTPEGYLAPLGRLTRFPTAWNANVGGNVLIDGREYAYIDGTCEIRLPAGPVEIEVSKGLEYEPLKQIWKRPDGQVSLRLAMERKSNLPAMNWWAGDTHVFFLSPHAASLEGAAEGLHVVNVLAAEWHQGQERFLSNILEFSGQQPAYAKDDCQVVVNTQNRHAIHGRLSLLHCHRAVFPLSLDSHAFSDWGLQDWCDQCHRKGGLVAWPSFPEHLDPGHTDLIPGKIDAIEWSPEADFPGAGLRAWYQMLNQGHRLPLVGGSAKTSNAAPLGRIRTYAQLESGQEFTYANWIEAIRRGRTFVTRGPLLRLDVGGHGPGGLVPPEAANQVCHFRLEAQSVLPFDRVELIQNGTVIADAPARNGLQATLEIERPLASPDAANAPIWFAARCFSGGRLSAHSSPVCLPRFGG